MIELKGKYNTAKIFTDSVDCETISQIMSILNSESYKDSLIRIMPDTHAGKGCTIGTTMTIIDKVSPNLVGVDISCGMLTTRLEQKELDLKQFDEIVRTHIPSGFNVHHKPINYETKDFEKRIMELKMLKRNKNLNINRFIQSIGTLGGGNHFIAIEQDDNGNNYLIIHSGSRSLGLAVAEFYQNLAIKNLENRYFNVNEKRREMIEQLKKENRQKDIAKELEKISNQKVSLSQVEKELAYLEGEELKNYLHDVKICQEYASLNRRTMRNILVEKAKLTILEEFETVHNYIDLDQMILRKGAISAHLGEKVLIPLNMRDGSLIAIGKGNRDWNYSACHGAGRLMSRSKAKQSIKLDDFKASMKGIYSSSVCEATLDESPFAYKPFEEIIDNVKDSVELIAHLKPIYNFKDSIDTSE